MWQPVRTEIVPTGIMMVRGEITQGLDDQGFPTSIDPGQYPSEPIETTQYTKYYEALDDNSKGSPFGVWHDVTHCKRDIELHSDAFLWRHKANDRPDAAAPFWTAKPGIPAWVAWGPQAGYWGPAGFPMLGLPALFEFGSDYDIPNKVLPGLSTNQLVSDAITTMLPGIRAKLSLINSLIELKDFKSLPRTIRNIENLIPSIYNNLKNKPLRGIFSALKAGGKAGYSVVHTGADGYLQYQFNIAPLLSDISGLHAALHEVQSEINKLRMNQAKKQKRHVSFRLPDTFGHTGSPDVSIQFEHQTYDSTFDGGAIFYRNVNVTKAMFNATMEYNYMLPPMTEDEYIRNGLLDKFGVNFNPKIIWNAIPWSFVVDWVLGVNQWLDNFGSRNIEPVTNITKFCWSVHVIRHISTSINSCTNGLHGDSGEQPMCTVNEDVYLRRVESLYGLDMYRLARLSGLSPTEISLGAALIITNHRPRH
jgi:hypothetical protein